MYISKAYVAYIYIHIYIKLILEILQKSLCKGCLHFLPKNQC